MSGITIQAAANDSANILIYDRIGSNLFEDGVTAKQFVQDLAKVKNAKTLNVRINSPGGAVFEGLAIYNALRDHGAKVITHNDALTASIASVIFMAGDERHVADNAFNMIHNPANVIAGDSREMRKAADMMDQAKSKMVAIYSERSGMDAEEVSKLMDAETWMDGTQAVANGFATHIAKASKMAASFDPAEFTNVPETLTAAGRNPQKKEPIMPEAIEAPKSASLAELRNSLDGADSDFILKQMEAQATLPQATAAWIKELSARSAAEKAATDKRMADLEATHKSEMEAAKKPAPKVGVAPLKTEPDAGLVAGGDPVAQLESLVALKVAAGKPKHEAFASVCRENVELRTAYVEAVNAKRR